jgi:hypothetical protein
MTSHTTHTSQLNTNTPVVRHQQWWPQHLPHAVLLPWAALLAVCVRAPASACCLLLSEPA